MPTAAKLIGAISFLLVAFFAAETVKPVFPEGFSFGYFSAVCAWIGFLVGWTVMGNNANGGARAAVNTGVRTSATVLFWVLFFFSVREMLLRSYARRYDGVMEAAEGMFDIALAFIIILVQSPAALAVLLAGGIFGGLLTHWAAARWP